MKFRCNVCHAQVDQSQTLEHAAQHVEITCEEVRQAMSNLPANERAILLAEWCARCGYRLPGHGLRCSALVVEVDEVAVRHYFAERLRTATTDTVEIAGTIVDRDGFIVEAGHPQEGCLLLDCQGGLEDVAREMNQSQAKISDR